MDWCWRSNTLATWCEELTHWERPWCWERLRAGAEENEMIGWHHWLTGLEFKQTAGDSEGQESLACYSSWGCTQLDTTYRLNKQQWHLLKVVYSAIISLLGLRGEVSWFSPRLLKVKVLVSQLCPLFATPWTVWPTRLLCSWNSPGKNTVVGSHSLLQGIFPTQGPNSGLLSWRCVLINWATARI